MENSIFQSPGEDLERYEFGEYLQYFGPTWWLWDEANFDILSKAGSCLDEMFETSQIKPNIVNNSVERIFEAKYEVLKYNSSSEHSEAFFTENAVVFLDFVIGIPYGCVERIGIVAETDEEVIGVPDSNRAVPPLLDDLFQEKTGVISVYNKMWLDLDNVKSFAKPVAAGAQLRKHWWLRYNIPKAESVHPVPGEFMCLVIFLFPNESWGWQKSNPTIFSGNWIETLFYTSGIVLEVLEDGAYSIQYRKDKVTAVSSDWTEYEVGDRVTILKDVDTPAGSFTWEDLKDYEEDEWVIAPITFYEGD